MNSAPPSRIAALDGLRGLAALEIVLRHLAAIYQVDYHPAVDLMLAPLRHGPVGHPLFFVLTGFGLTHGLLGRDEPRLGPFLAGRWRRLAPPYYVALALCLVVPSGPGDEGRHRGGGDPPDLPTILDHVLLVHGLRPGSVFAISPPFWSMSLTAQFCLAFPLLHVALMRVGVRKATAAILATWLAARAAIEWRFGLDSMVASAFILHRLPPFLFGMAVAHWQRRGGEVTPSRVGRRWAALATAALIAAVALQEMTWGWPVDLLYGVGYALAAMAVIESSRRGGPLAKFLGRPALTWLGATSFALYLSHDLVLSRWIGFYRGRIAGPGLAADLAMLATGVGLALAFGRVFCLRVERPLRDWAEGRGRPARREPRPVPLLEVSGATVGG